MKLSKDTIYKALRLIRENLDVPKIFTGIVEVDGTYIGGQWKNKRKIQKLKEPKSKRGKGTKPVFGILCRDGYVYAET